MSNTLIGIGIVSFLCLAMSALSYLKFTPDWVDKIKFSWLTTNLIGGATGLVVGTLGVFFAGEFDYRVLSLTAVAWLAGIVFVTDYSDYSIPKRSTQITYPLVAASLIWAYLDTSLIGVFIATGITMLLPLALFFVSGMGMGDVRLFFVFALAFPWWFTLSGWAYAMLIAATLGLVSFMVSYIFKIGREIEHESGAVLNAINDKHKVKKSNRRAVPFGPPLMTGYVLFGLFMLATWGETMPANMMQSPLL